MAVGTVAAGAADLDSNHEMPKNTPFPIQRGGNDWCRSSEATEALHRGPKLKG
jgi:hypothetical protein